MKRIISSIALASIIATSGFAADSKTTQVSKQAVIQEEKNAQQTNQLVKEAITAIRYTQDAIIYLNGKNISKAKKSIKNAIAELSDVLNRPNAPYLLPVSIDIEAYQFNGNLKTIKEAISKAKFLVIENKLPQAREILNTLRDEIVIKSTNLPLATYPATLNLALKYVNEGKIKEAKDVLDMALSTLVEINTIIPIPIVKAEQLVISAQKIVKKDKKEAIKYLEEAKNQLTLAKALGYTSKSDTTYKILETSINNLEKELKTNHQTTNLFEKLIQKIKEFKEKAITHTSK